MSEMRTTNKGQGFERIIERKGDRKDLSDAGGCKSETPCFCCIIDFILQNIFKTL